MTAFGKVIFLAASLLAAAPASSLARPGDDTQRQALAVSQQAVGRVLSERTFTDQDGKTVRLSDFRGKPLVIGFIYTSCTQSCPVVIESLANAVAVGRDALGRDSFNVAVIGFDAGRDTPDALRLFARRHGLDRPGWSFLSGDLIDVATLTDETGFTFFRSAKGFDHLDQVTVIDKNGTVHSQVYGAAFETPLLIEPLKGLVYGTSSPWSSPGELWKKIKLFCTIYDPAADRYRVNYSLFYKVFVGATIIAVMIGFVGRNFWRLRRRDGMAGRRAL